MLYIVTHRVKGLNEDVLFHAIFEKKNFYAIFIFWHCFQIHKWHLDTQCSNQFYNKVRI